MERTLLDTNVLLEMMKESPDQSVQNWFAAQDSAMLYTSTIVEGEMRRGVEALPENDPHRESLAADIDKMIAQDFAGRVLPFDSTITYAYAVICAQRQKAGKSVKDKHADCLIAATALAHSAAIATRNVKDFKDFGIEIINPWDFGR